MKVEIDTAKVLRRWRWFLLAPPAALALMAVRYLWEHASESGRDGMAFMGFVVSAILCIVVVAWARSE